MTSETPKPDGASGYHSDRCASGVEWSYVGVVLTTAQIKK